MKHEVKKLDKSQMEIKVELTVEEVKPFLVKAATKISESIKIPGFRPGKAPYDIVKQKVSEAKILEEALDNIVAKTYYDVLQLEKIMAIGQPKIDLEKIAPDNPLIYKATVAILPKVKLGDYKSIKLKRQAVAVKDEQVDKIIEDLRKMRAKEKSVERGAKTGDRLEIDFDIFINKVPIENGQHKKYPITIGEGRFIPGFEEQLVDLHAGDEKEFELKFPDSYQAKNLAGKTATFKVKCHSVFEIELANIDDEFAKTISGGQFKNVAELNDSIKNNLIAEEKAKQEQRLEAEMLEKIVEISEFEDELPDVLIDNEVDRMFHEMEHSISHQGMKMEDYLKSLNKTEIALKEDFRPQGEKRVKTSIIAREVYGEQNIKVTDEEVEQEISKMMKNYPANDDARRQLESDSYKDYIHNVIGNRKVIEYLKGIILSD